MKRVLKVLSGMLAVMPVLLLVPGSISAQKNKTPQRTELSVDFRDAAGDKIHSNNRDPFYSNQNTPSYPNDVVFSSGGSLYMRIQDPEPETYPNQRVVFEFSDPLNPWRNERGKVTCQEYSPYGTGTPFDDDPPGFLLGDGRPNSDFAVFQSLGNYTETSGKWNYNSATFSVKDVTDVAYVAMNIRFDVADESGPFGVLFGYMLWGPPPVAPQTSGMMGIVQVTRASGTSWYVEPLPADHPLAMGRGVAANQAALFVSAPSVKKGHGGGNCDLGDWRMPFAMTLTLR